MRSFVIVLLTILFLSTPLLAERIIEVPESELREYLDRIEKDDKTIKALQAENYQLKLDKMNLETELVKWKQADDKQMGFYLGGGIGYPLPSVEIAVLYKFRKWGLFASGGYYGKAPAVNIGIMVKTK